MQRLDVERVEGDRPVANADLVRAGGGILAGDELEGAALLGGDVSLHRFDGGVGVGGHDGQFAVSDERGWLG